MIFKWYQIFNLDEFSATGLTSRTYSVTLIGIGPKDVLVTKGDSISILYDDIFLSLSLNSKNPFTFGGYGIYRDGVNDVWLGVPV